MTDVSEATLNGIRTTLAALGRPWTVPDVARALRRVHMAVTDDLLLHVTEQLRISSVGAGPLEPFLRLAGVTDVLVNGASQVFVDCGAGLEPVASPFADDDAVRTLAVRLAASAERRLDDASPYVDARLAGGVRLHAVLAPLAEPGTCISLRIPSGNTLTLDDWIAGGGLHPQLAQVLQAIIAKRVAFLVSGGTGTGKTTLLASLLSLVPAHERILVVEDSRELKPSHPHVVSLEARHANAEGAGIVTLTDMVRQALRMRPDRLVLGEVRGAELIDLLIAMNTGHEGGCGTVHANSALDVPARLEALAALGGLGRVAAHAQIASAIQLVIHLRREPFGRFVNQIGVLHRTGEIVEVEMALQWSQPGGLQEGPAIKALKELLAL
ncbi:MAG: TadA family conjugal transfer-associated ATPase [Propionibacteriaceae bacterium]|jgi:pilus assembly protein CpaF|nr:TadA family conjugal transfer-associated ATPase [Propionibacteriaceae bacterium]